MRTSFIPFRFVLRTHLHINIDTLIGDLLGGEDRIDDTLFSKSGDSIICNFGTEYWTNVRLFTELEERHYVEF